MGGFPPGEEEEEVRVLEFQEPEVAGEGGRAPELKIQNRNQSDQTLYIVADMNGKVLIILHRGKTPAYVKVRQAALVGSAPWPDPPITHHSSLGIKC